MKRKIANKLASVYTPSLVIVLITFTTFWLGPASIADRITIGITAFLAIVTQFSQSRDELPPVSYMSVSPLICHVTGAPATHVSVLDQGMDVWNLVCMVFVSSQILQATLVHFLNERRAVRDDSSRDGSKDRAADEKDGVCLHVSPYKSSTYLRPFHSSCRKDDSSLNFVYFFLSSLSCHL